MQEVDISLPRWLGGGDFTIITGFDIGVGDADTRKIREDRIEARTAAAEELIASRDAETARKLKEAFDAQQALGSTMMNNINDLSNSNNSTTSSTTNNIGGGNVDTGLDTSRFVNP